MRRRDREIVRFTGHVCRRHVTKAKIEALCGLMIRRIGGVEGFADCWWESLSRAMEDEPGSRRCLDSFRALVKLIQLADETKSRRMPKTADMSDEDLEEVLRQGCAGLSM